MKSIGISDEVYEQLLNTKHMFEKQKGVVLSFDKIIDILIDGEKKDGKNDNIKKQGSILKND